MAAITSVSNLSIGARSVSFSAVSTGTDTLAFSVIAAAYLAAGGSATDAIYSFLTTSHTDVPGTLAAIASNGVVVAPIASAAAAVVTVGGDNSFSIAAAGTVAFRIALKSSISA